MRARLRSQRAGLGKTFGKRKTAALFECGGLMLRIRPILLLTERATPADQKRTVAPNWTRQRLAMLSIVQLPGSAV